MKTKVGYRQLAVRIIGMRNKYGEWNLFTDNIYCLIGSIIRVQIVPTIFSDNVKLIVINYSINF